MSTTSHTDLRTDEMYLMGTRPTYILQKLKKGDTGNIKKGTVIQLPPELSTACGPACELLRGKDTCVNHSARAGKVTLQGWTGTEASLTSYVVVNLTSACDKAENILWIPNIDQVTSRSISHYLYVDRLDEIAWSTTDWENKNYVLADMFNTIWSVLGQTPKPSQVLDNTADANYNRAVKLFKKLVAELTTQENKKARYAQGTAAFADRMTFIASLNGANGHYSGYTPFDAPQAAFMQELVLKFAARTHKDQVDEILECYKKVQKAKAHEEVPFAYDRKVVEAVIMAKKFSKPADKPAEVALPF